MKLKKMVMVLSMTALSTAMMTGCSGEKKETAAVTPTETSTENEKNRLLSKLLPICDGKMN